MLSQDATEGIAQRVEMGHSSGMIPEIKVDGQVLPWWMAESGPVVEYQGRGLFCFHLPILTEASLELRCDGSTPDGYSSDVDGMLQSVFEFGEDFSLVKIADNKWRVESTAKNERV